jgi:Zn-dependent metalloprotease
MMIMEQQLITMFYGDAYDNAFWNGTAMTYGDGSYQGGTNLMENLLL